MPSMATKCSKFLLISGILIAVSAHADDVEVGPIHGEDGWVDQDGNVLTLAEFNAFIANNAGNLTPVEGYEEAIDDSQSTEDMDYALIPPITVPNGTGTDQVIVATQTITETKQWEVGASVTTQTGATVGAEVGGGVSGVVASVEAKAKFEASFMVSTNLNGVYGRSTEISQTVGVAAFTIPACEIYRFDYTAEYYHAKVVQRTDGFRFIVTDDPTKWVASIGEDITYDGVGDNYIEITMAFSDIGDVEGCVECD